MKFTRNQIILAVAGVVTLGSLGLCCLGGSYGAYEYMAKRERQRTADEVHRRILGVPDGVDLEAYSAQLVKDNKAKSDALIEVSEAEKAKDPQRLREANAKMNAVWAEIEARNKKAKK